MSLVSLVCPLCKAELQSSVESYQCGMCGRTYRCVMGIPSLIVPEVEDTPAEEALVRQLSDIYPDASYEELALVRIAAGSTTDDCRRHFARYNLVSRDRGPRFYRMFRHRLNQQKWPAPRARLALDVGCGTGAGLPALAREFEHVVGLDLNLSSLIVAQKLVDSECLCNVTLVHASALHLPFRDNTFDYAMAINVLEHVLTPEMFLAEMHRVLAIDGTFCGDSRNRFDLLFPEPHVGLRWVGFLPRRWMAGYVRWRIGVDYRVMHARLLSYQDLKRALTMSFGSEWHVALPDVSVYGMPDAIHRWVEWANRFKPLHPFLIRLSPSHLVLARRAA